MTCTVPALEPRSLPHAMDGQLCLPCVLLAGPKASRCLGGSDRCSPHAPTLVGCIFRSARRSGVTALVSHPRKSAAQQAPGCPRARRSCCHAAST